MSTFQHRLLLISCSATKTDTPGKIPACERYNGKTYQVIRKALRELNLAGLEIKIISAKHGLIDWQTPIENYDLEMSRTLAQKHKRSIHEQLYGLLSENEYACVHINMGVTYRKTLEGFNWQQPVDYATGRIGEKNSCTKRWLEAIAIT